MTKDSKRVVLAYSGGLDTSCILRWLIDEGFEVICFLANVGQPSEDTEALKAKALKLGAKACYVPDCKKDFVTDYIFPAYRANAVYEGRYLLGTAIARPCIVKAFVEVAKKENCKYLSHGATGKGNDQVRFELHANALDPTLSVIAPWRIERFLKRFQGRGDLLKYAAENGIQVEQTAEKSYSMDENLLHISYESGVLEDPGCPPPRDMFRMTVDPEDAPDKSENFKISFEKGDPVRIENLDDGTVKTEALELFTYLNEIGGKHGIGRIDIVENRFVGIKSRGVYETPGGEILMSTRVDLETLVLDVGVMRARDSLRQRYSELVYNGFWFSPEMRFLQATMDKAQENMEGEVTFKLYKGNLTILGRRSPVSLYNEELASMEVEGDYNANDAEGFIHINGLRLKAWKVLEDQLATSGKAQLHPGVPARGASKFFSYVD